MKSSRISSSAGFEQSQGFTKVQARKQSRPAAKSPLMLSSASGGELLGFISRSVLQVSTLTPQPARVRSLSLYT